MYLFFREGDGERAFDFGLLFFLSNERGDLGDLGEEPGDAFEEGPFCCKASGDGEREFGGEDPLFSFLPLVEAKRSSLSSRKSLKRDRTSTVIHKGTRGTLLLKGAEVESIVASPSRGGEEK